MKVWVCKRRDDGSVVDVLEQSVHPVLTPDTIRTFDCTDGEWTEEDLREYHYVTSPVALENATPEQIQAELVRRNELESFKTMLQVAITPKRRI